MILTPESGAEEDQFDEKKRRPKISWYYPFKLNYKRVGVRHRTEILRSLDSHLSLHNWIHWR